jgi:hypothetical protein
MYVQLAFALDRVKALAPEHPEWKTTERFAAAFSGDLPAVAASGEKGLLDLVTATHAGRDPGAELDSVPPYIDLLIRSRIPKRLIQDKEGPL